MLDQVISDQEYSYEFRSTYARIGRVRPGEFRIG
jgi:hypothetical protein